MPHKIFDNDLVAISKNKVTLTPNKPVCIGLCILECVFYDYIKNKYGKNSRLFSIDTDV